MSKRVLTNAEKSYHEALHKDFLWSKAIKNVKPIGVLEKPKKADSKKNSKEKED